MIRGPLSRRAEELAAAGTPFVTATVVRAQSPASATPGSAALVHGDGTIEGFVGGVCAEDSVRRFAARALGDGEPVLLRILPDEGGHEHHDHHGDRGEEPADVRDGAVTVTNHCLSGGAIEVFLEPVLPAPRVVVAGETPIAEALRRLAPELGLEPVSGRLPAAGDFALVVAAHGRDELENLRAALTAGVPYVGLVASEKRGAGVLGELRDTDLDDDAVARVDVPAGLAIGARTPAEIALAILAQVVAVRREERVRAGVTG